MKSYKLDLQQLLCHQGTRRSSKKGLCLAADYFPFMITLLTTILKPSNTRSGAISILLSLIPFVIFSLSLIMSYTADIHAKEMAQFKLINEKVIDIVQSPLKAVQRGVDLIMPDYQHLSPDKAIEIAQSRKDIKWVFPAEGVSLVSPVINPEDGTVYATTTDIDIEANLKDLPDNGPDAITIGDLHSNVYALRPKSIGNRGSKKWVFSMGGIVIFQPVVSTNNKTVFVESINGEIDLENQTFEFSGGKLFAIDQDGKDLWGRPAEFEGEIFLGPPVIGNDGTIYTTTIKIADISNITELDFSGVISAIDPTNGEVKWRFNPSELSDDKFLFTIAPPAVAPTGDTIFINAISTVSTEEIEGLITSAIPEIQDEIADLINNTIPSLLEAIENQQDINPILDDIEDDVESLFNLLFNDLIKEILNLGTIFALDSDKNIKWDSTFPGVSLSSPVAADSGVVNTGGVNVPIEDISTDVNIDAKLNPEEGTIEANLDVRLLVLGATFGVKIGIELNLEDPSGTLKLTDPKIALPDLEDIDASLIGTLNGIDSANGNLLWSTNIGEAIFNKPVVINNLNQTIVGASGFSINTGQDGIEPESLFSKIYSINTSNGDIGWESESFNGVIVGFTPVDSIIGDPLLVGRDGSVFFSFFDITAGEDEAEIPSFKVLGVNQGGTTKWEEPFVPDGLVTSAPVINKDDDMLFISISSVKDLFEELPLPPMPSREKRPKLRDLVPDLKGKLVAINPVDGTTSKSIEIDGFPIASPAIDEKEKAIYVGTADIGIGKRPLSIELLSFIHAARLD